MEKAENHEGAPKNINTPGTPSAVDDVPDPEEDDLDDLDGMIGTVLNYSLLVLNVVPDMLDEFSATKIHKPEDASKSLSLHEQKSYKSRTYQMKPRTSSASSCKSRWQHSWATWMSRQR